MTLPALSLDEVRAFLAREFPQIDRVFVVDDVGDMRATMRLKFHEMHLRPGGTISGPSMFGWPTLRSTSRSSPASGRSRSRSPPTSTSTF